MNVPNASIMVIERAESFGLAQLHQLRGRVGRGRGGLDLPADVPAAAVARPATKRLTTLRETEDGFRIAEVDLEMRGAGDVIGTAQSGAAAVPHRRSGTAGGADGAWRRATRASLLADDPGARRAERGGRRGCCSG